MLKPRNIRTFGKVREQKEVKVSYMGYVAETGEYFISEEKDPKLNKEECREWAELNNGKLLKRVDTIAYYEEIIDGVWVNADI